MFLFIVYCWPLLYLYSPFKYISCSYLSIYDIHTLLPEENLNTSHVLIYLVSFDFACAVPVFKYISCSYLSAGDIEPSKMQENLNTSHVLIYHNMGIIL